MQRSIVPGEERKVLPGLALVHTRNHGVAFGFLPGHHLIVTVVIAVALLALLAYFARHSSRPLIWLPTGMLIGGALGNLIDRVRAGSVTDFVKLPLGWPPFNLADASITLGVLILVLVIERAPLRPSADRRAASRRRRGASSERDRRRRRSPFPTRMPTCCVVDEARRSGRAPRARPSRGHGVSPSCWPAAVDAPRRCGEGMPSDAGHRAPPRPRHLRPARRRALRGGATAA